jgi:hypothetical protein
MADDTGFALSIMHALQFSNVEVLNFFLYNCGVKDKEQLELLLQTEQGNELVLNNIKHFIYKNPTKAHFSLQRIRVCRIP